MASIEIRNLLKSFGGFPVIADLNLQIADHEFVVFVGPSGCGKSTLLRIIAGLEPITSGDVLIGDKRVNDLPAAQRNIAMVFQDYALYPHMTVYDNMSFALELRGMSKAEIDAKVRRAAAMLENSGALKATLERARGYGAIARQALEIFPAGPEKAALLEAVDFSATPLGSDQALFGIYLTADGANFDVSAGYGMAGFTWFNVSNSPPYFPYCDAVCTANIGDFSDTYNRSVADRAKAFEGLKAHFGHDWLMLANPSYGSWESAPYAHNYKLSSDEKRAKKIEVLTPWPAKQ